MSEHKRGPQKHRAPERDWAPLTDATIIERVVRAYKTRCKREGWVYVRPERFLISGSTVVMLVGHQEVGRYQAVTSNSTLKWVPPILDSGLGDLHASARPTTRRERLQNAAWGLNRPLPMGWCTDGDLLPGDYE